MVARKMSYIWIVTRCVLNHWPSKLNAIKEKGRYSGAYQFCDGFFSFSSRINLNVTWHYRCQQPHSRRHLYMFKFTRNSFQRLRSNSFAHVTPFEIEMNERKNQCNRWNGWWELGKYAHWLIDSKEELYFVIERRFIYTSLMKRVDIWIDSVASQLAIRKRKRD